MALNNAPPPVILTTVRMREKRAVRLAFGPNLSGPSERTRSLRTRRLATGLHTAAPRALRNEILLIFPHGVQKVE